MTTSAIRFPFQILRHIGQHQQLLQFVAQRRVTRLLVRGFCGFANRRCDINGTRRMIGLAPSLRLFRQTLPCPCVFQVYLEILTKHNVEVANG